MLDHRTTLQASAQRTRSAPVPKLQAARFRQAVVGRLAWIFADRDSLMLLRKPLLVEAVGRRHHVLVLAPGLTAADQAALAALGIDSAVISLPAWGYNPFRALAARHRLSRALWGFGANAVLIEDGENLVAAAQAATQAGVAAIYPVLPSLEGTQPAGPNGSAPTSRTSWRAALRSAKGVFVPTPNDARLLEKPLAKLRLSSHVLPLACQDLSALHAAVLPPLDDGFIFLGLCDGHVAAEGTTYGRAVAACNAPYGRVRFEMADVCSDAPRRDRMSMTAGLDIHEAGGDVVASLRQRVLSAHCIVVDDVGAHHTLLLTLALAMGRPVLAIDDARYRNLVDVGVNGWLVPADDPNALRERMAALLRRPDLLPGMARGARQKAERQIDQRASAELLFGVLGLADLRANAA